MPTIRTRLLILSIAALVALPVGCSAPPPSGPPVITQAVAAPPPWIIG